MTPCRLESCPYDGVHPAHGRACTSCGDELVGSGHVKRGYCGKLECVVAYRRARAERRAAAARERYARSPLVRAKKSVYNHAWYELWSAHTGRRSHGKWKAVDYPERACDWHRCRQIYKPRSKLQRCCSRTCQKRQSRADWRFGKRLERMRKRKQSA